MWDGAYSSKEINKYFTKNKSLQSLDNKDIQIIKSLGENARITLLELSSKLKTSPDTIAYRLKKLEGTVIKGYTPVISYSNLGYSMSALLLTIHNLDKIKEEKIKQFCLSYHTILWAVKTIGKYNIMMYVCTENQRELQETITELRSLLVEQIKGYQSLLGVAEYAYTYAPEILFKNLLKHNNQ